MRIVISYTTLLLLLVCLCCQGWMEEERDALEQIKTSINTPEGTAFSNWYGEDCCQWEGVECNASTSHVVRIFSHHKRDPSLLGNWYPNATVFAQFKNLQELYLPGNQIGGFISPNDCSKSLRQMPCWCSDKYFYENSAALHKLKYLQRLDLRENSIEDSSLLCCDKSPLYFLDLSSNRLQGHIPNCLSNLTSLRHLVLSNNQLNGNFPSLLISNLTNIESLIISDNWFKGLIHFSIFANLSKLTHLDISYNAYLEVETESPTWFPTFNLNRLKLGGCNLNKQSGIKIPSFIFIQHHLQSLDLSDNSLVGSIPSWLIYNVTSELWMRGNNLSGSFPRSFQNRSSQLITLDISNNFLHGPLPEDINLILPDILRINASMNIFNGSLPPSFGEMKQLQNLDLSGNDLHGEIPQCMTSNMTSLEYLKLSNNYFQGEMFPRNSSLPNLRWLYLGRNNFTEISPDGMSNISSLQILNARYNYLSGKLSKKLPALPSLRVLVLAANSFEGRIPLQLCHMEHLTILDLSTNILSGSIPSCLGNITSWKESSSSQLDIYPLTKYKDIAYWDVHIFTFFTAVDLSSNKLTGRIPVEMGELAQIHGINVSNNLLTGEIPVSLRNLTQVEWLDLSNNKLSGLLPQELVALTSLAVFNVSINNLSGRIPQGGQFDTFMSDSFVGNPNLCGFPLSKECIKVTEKPSHFRSAAPIWLPHTPWCLVVSFFFFIYIN